MVFWHLGACDHSDAYIYLELLHKLDGLECNMDRWATWAHVLLDSVLSPPDDFQQLHDNLVPDTLLVLLAKSIDLFDRIRSEWSVHLLHFAPHFSPWMKVKSNHNQFEIRKQFNHYNIESTSWFWSTASSRWHNFAFGCRKSCTVLVLFSTRSI